MRDLQNIVHELKAKGAALKATEQPIDTSNAAGKCFLDMLGVFAEFETNRGGGREWGVNAPETGVNILCGIRRPDGADEAEG